MFCIFLPQTSSAAAAAKSLQSCPTLCDPIDGSPPGSPVPGTLQARTPEWVKTEHRPLNVSLEETQITLTRILFAKEVMWRWLSSRYLRKCILMSMPTRKGELSLVPTCSHADSEGEWLTCSLLRNTVQFRQVIQSAVIVLNFTQAAPLWNWALNHHYSCSIIICHCIRTQGAG